MLSVGGLQDGSEWSSSRARLDCVGWASVSSITPPHSLSSCVYIFNCFTSHCAGLSDDTWKKGACTIDTTLCIYKYPFISLSNCPNCLGRHIYAFLAAVFAMTSFSVRIIIPGKLHRVLASYMTSHSFLDQLRHSLEMVCFLTEYWRPER